jgi:hypothetical protein
MTPRPLVIVGETPSLGRSIGDLLVSEGIPCRLVSDLTPRELESWPSGPPPVILVACNEVYCRTARRWARGEFPGAALVVVGARDPELRFVRGARVLPLPLQRERLFGVLREFNPEPQPGPG